MKFRFDSYCGLYCGACGVVHAVEKGNLEEMAAKWKSTPEAMECYGCKSDQVAEFAKKCKIRLCAIEKGLDFCFECDEYPCERMTDFLENQSVHPRIHIDNLQNIKEKGLETWLAEQNDRWSCNNCGTKFHFDEITCIQCGATLYNLVEEANDLKKGE